jgi:hypothetical protein
MFDKNRYLNPSHVGVKYVRDQLIMLPHTHVNWRSYESVRVRPFFARSASPLGDGMRKKDTEIPPERAFV